MIHDIDADSRQGVGIVIVAAGSGSRLGAEVPKAFVEVAGRSLLSYAVERAGQVSGLRSLVLVVPQGWSDPRALQGAGVELVTGMSVVLGGAHRSDSVRLGIARVDDGCDVILVHDAARAFTPTTVFEGVVAAVRAGRATGVAGVVPGLPVVDTIKAVDERGVIVSTPPRDRLRAVQTPQGFDATVLRAAYASGVDGTDDAAVVEAFGRSVAVVEGDPAAFKVTTPADLERARALVPSSWDV